jgi:hypothetical protein
MELNQQASFIPKKPIVSQPEVGYGEGGFSVVTFISVILFVLSLSLAAGVTLYQSVKIKQLADKEASYKKAINDPNQAPNLHRAYIYVPNIHHSFIHNFRIFIRKLCRLQHILISKLDRVYRFNIL